MIEYIESLVRPFLFLEKKFNLVLKFYNPKNRSVGLSVSCLDSEP